MREIKFRGFSKILNTWTYGDLIQNGSKFYIAKQGFLVSYECFGTSINILGFEEFEDIFEVKPESIGQYTGLKDKNGKEIYEGDIVERVIKCWNDIFKPSDFKEITERGYVKYIQNDCCFMIVNDKYETMHKIEKDFEVIGNIYEDPDLLKG